MTGWSPKRINREAHRRAWAGYGDHETYHAVRDGPRLQRSQAAVATLAWYLPPEQVALANRLAAMYARVHAGYGRGSGEIAERVQGGAYAQREHRMRELSELIRTLTGYAGAALSVGKDGYGCFRGICLGDSQAEMMRRVRYPEGSKMTFRRLVQQTLNALQDYAEHHAERADRQGLDAETNSEAYSR